MALDMLMRARLAKPFGAVMEFAQVTESLRAKRPSRLIAVGDHIVFNLISAQIIPDIAVYDNFCQRKEVPREWSSAISNAAMREGGSVRAPNPPGTIHPAMEARVRDVLSIGGGWVEIEGEDDLASLVVMAYAPLGSLLLYGQPNAGVVWVDIDGKRQQEAKGILAEIRKN